MLYYHGSPMIGLTVLEPRTTYYQKTPYVYLSTSEVVAAFYLSKREYMWFTYGFDARGVPVYTESYPGCLAEFFGGLSGCIYVCEGEFFQLDATNIRVAAVSEAPIRVCDVLPVEDCLQKLEQYEAQGRLIIRRHAELTGTELRANDDMIRGAIKNLRLTEGGHPLSSFVRDKFPKLWAEALTNSRE